MATWDDVRDAVATLPDVAAEDGDTLAWSVGRRTLLWERPLRKYEVAELGAAMRDVEVLAVRVSDVGVRDALVADEPSTFFTTSHFRDYPAVLCWLDRLTPAQLHELVEEAAAAPAPPTRRRTRRSPGRPG